MHSSAQEMQLPRKMIEVAALRICDKSMERQAATTGYPTLDKVLKGLVPGRLYGLTGDTNVGKTAFACNLTHNVLSQKKRVLYFALEPDRTLVDYLASIRLKKPYLDLDDADLIYDDSNLDIYGADQINTIEKLIQAVETLDPYNLIVIDHIGYFIKTDVNNFNAEQGNVLKKLALLAQAKYCPIMYIAHLNKTFQPTPERWLPNMNQISGTASFKQDTDEMLVIARKPEEGSQGEMRLTTEGAILVAKTKSGQGGYIPIWFNETCGLIRESPVYLPVKELDEPIKMFGEREEPDGPKDFDF